MSWEKFVSSVLSPFFYWGMPNQRIFWFYLLTAFCMAICAYVFFYRKQFPHVQKSILRFCFPKEVYLHKSAKTDYKFFLVNRVAMLLLVAPILLGAKAVSDAVAGLLTGSFGISGGIYRTRAFCQSQHDPYGGSGL